MTRSKGTAKNRNQMFLIISVLLKLIIHTFTFLYHCHDSLKETQYFKIVGALLFHLPSPSFTLA